MQREEFIPMMESGKETVLKKKIRPCIPRILYGFLGLLFVSGGVLISSSFREVPSGAINIISGSTEYDSSGNYYFQFPWDYTERVNVPLRGNVIVFPTLAAAQKGREIAIYKKCKLTYNISNLGKFAEAVNGDANKFTFTLLEKSSDYVEEEISNMTAFKAVLSTDDIDPLAGIDYLSSTAFNCTQKGFQVSTTQPPTSSTPIVGQSQN